MAQTRFDVIKAKTDQNGLSLAQRKIRVSLNLAHTVTPFLLTEGDILIHSYVFDGDIFHCKYYLEQNDKDNYL